MRSLECTGSRRGHRVHRCRSLERAADGSTFRITADSGATFGPRSARATSLRGAQSAGSRCPGVGYTWLLRGPRPSRQFDLLFSVSQDDGATFGAPVRLNLGPPGWGNRGVRESRLRDVARGHGPRVDRHESLVQREYRWRRDVRRCVRAGERELAGSIVPVESVRRDCLRRLERFVTGRREDLRQLRDVRPNGQSDRQCFRTIPRLGTSSAVPARSVSMEQISRP